MKRVLLVVAAVVFAGGVACSPRYTSRQVEVTEEVQPSADIRIAIREANLRYEAGVEFYAKDEFDSAAVHLENAIALLSQDLDWSSYDKVLSERRHLLYKCRYFLERIPSEVTVRPPGAGLDGIRPTKPPLPPVELVRNPRVDKWIRYFTGDGRDCFIRWVTRSGKYRDDVLRILLEEGLPAEFANLALIESGFYPLAYSRAHAVGLWQFIESTGKIYGLRIDWWVDERKDPLASTRAAARHLRDLYASFDSWPLALASYNWGQRKVEQAMKRYHTRDYWKLRINAETSDYVPKFMAACIIMEDPEAYGFSFTYDKALAYEMIDVEPRTHLGAVAKSCRVDTSAILELNPHLIRGCAPDDKSFYQVRIPEGTHDICRLTLIKLPREERIASTFLTPTVRHTVRRGETVSGIAARYGVGVEDIVRANSITNRNRIRVGEVLTVPGGEFRGSVERPGVHVVEKNETLSTIARRYGVRLRDLERWNNLGSPHLIYPGQRLVLEAGALSEGADVIHSVGVGETLSGIAGKYGLSLQEILDANRLNPNDVIHPGQRIRVPGASVAAVSGTMVVHKVRSGDTVSEIGRKYGVSTDAVLRANAIGEGSKIYPGQELLVPVSPGGISGGEIVFHEVESGESIYSIAKKYAVACEEVLALNDLRPDNIIRPGQKIVLPPGKSKIAQSRFHTVSRGETISGIASRYGVSTSAVLRVNGLGSRDRIYPGQRIEIPAQ